MPKKIYCPYFLTGTEFDWIDDVIEVYSPEEADIVVFSGGSDINPSLYNCKCHKFTYYNEKRDKLEIECYNKLTSKQIVIGLCRGAQLLTALNGGKLIQDVTGHNNGPHYITNGESRFKIESIHHQMMYPFDMDSNDYDLLYWSSIKKSSKYEGDGIANPEKEPEVIYYHKKDKPQALAIQGHPEMMGKCNAHKVFNELIKKMLKHLEK